MAAKSSNEIIKLDDEHVLKASATTIKGTPLMLQLLSSLGGVQLQWQEGFKRK
jgi:hypothetical protein